MLVMHYPFAPCHRRKMFEEVIIGLMLEFVMTLTDHIDCIIWQDQNNTWYWFNGMEL